MRNRLILLLTAGAVLACRRPAAQPSTTSAARYGPECTTAIARARAEPASPDITPPVPTKLPLPPMPVPASVRGSVAVYEVPVDSAGRVDRGAAILHGVADAQYAATLRGLLRQTTFRPALLDGCGVPGVARITYQLP
jgi:hypothetical protein